MKKALALLCIWGLLLASSPATFAGWPSNGKYAGVSGGGAVTWDPGFLPGNLSLSGGNLIVTQSHNAWNLVRSTTSHSTGLYYLEATGTSGITNLYNLGIGLIDGSAVNTNFAGADTHGVSAFNPNPVFYNSGSIGTAWATGVSSNNVALGLAINLNTGKLWWVSGTNQSQWNGSSSNSPATGVGGISLSITCPCYVALSEDTEGGSNVVANGNFGATSFTLTTASAVASGAGYGNW